MLMNNFSFLNIIQFIDQLDELFLSICILKHSIVKLKSKELTNFKHNFYSLNFPTWQLNLLWEMIWDDRSSIEVATIFINKKLLKEGDTIGKINRPEKKKDNC